MDKLFFFFTSFQVVFERKINTFSQKNIPISLYVMKVIFQTFFLFLRNFLFHLLKQYLGETILNSISSILKKIDWILLYDHIHNEIIDNSIKVFNKLELCDFIKSAMGSITEILFQLKKLTILKRLNFSYISNITVINRYKSLLYIQIQRIHPA
jgi:hypothetical protein